MTARLFRIRCGLVKWAVEELRSHRYHNACSLLRAAFKGDLT